MDIFSPSDPFVEVSIKRPFADLGPTAFTKVVWNNNSAVFDSSLDIACAKSSTVDALWTELNSTFGTDVDPDLFVIAADDSAEIEANRSFEEFLRSIPCF